MKKSKTVRTGILMAFAAGAFSQTGCDNMDNVRYSRPLIYRDHPRIEELDKQREKDRPYSGSSGSHGGSHFFGFGTTSHSTPGDHGNVSRGGFGSTGAKSSGGS